MNTQIFSRFVLPLKGKDIVRWDPERAFFPQTEFQLGIYLWSKGCERQDIDMSQRDLQIRGDLRHVGEFHRKVQVSAIVALYIICEFYFSVECSVHVCEIHQVLLHSPRTSRPCNYILRKRNGKRHPAWGSYV